MKICFLNHDLLPGTGAGRFGLNLIHRLRAASSGLAVAVLVSLASGDPLERVVIPESRIRALASIPKIRRIFRSCEIIHALDGYPYGVIAAIASICLGKKFVITAIGSGAVQPLYWWSGFLLRWAYRKADRVVAISENTKREILKKVPHLNISVINHAVDANDFVTHSDEELTPEECETIAALRPYLLSVGGWKKRKGFEYSFPAFAEILKKNPDLQYVVCGMGKKNRLESPYGLDGKVTYFKKIRWPFLRALYKNAQLFMLLPVDDEKDIEGFGFAFLEAAAAGIPVVGTRESSVEDAMRDGENGYLVPPRDAHAAAEATCLILQNPELRKKFSEGSLVFAKKMNWDRVINGYEKIYQDLLEK